MFYKNNIYAGAAILAILFVLAGAGMTGCGGPRYAGKSAGGGDDVMDADLTPEEVCRTYFEAEKTGDFAIQVNCMHPDALEAFRTMLLEIVEAAPASELDEVLTLFAGVDDLRDLYALNPAKFFTSFWVGYCRLDPEMERAIRSCEYQIKGTMMKDGDAFVLVQVTLVYEGVEYSELQTIPLGKHQGEWRIQLAGGISGVQDSFDMSEYD